MNEPSQNLLVSPWRFSLADALRWLVLVGVYFGVLAAYPNLSRSFRDNTPPTPGTVATLTGCWLLLLGYYVRRWHFGPLAVHLAPVVLVLPFAALGPNHHGGRGAVTLLLTCCLDATASFPLSLWKGYSQASRRFLSPRRNVAVNLPGGVELTAAACWLIPSLAIGRLYWPGMVYGSILGFWLGLKQAVDTSQAVAQARVFGLSVRALATGGLVGALFGPIIPLLLIRFVLVLEPFPMRYSSVYGVPSALLAAGLEWLDRER